MRRVSISRDQIDLVELALHHSDVENALRDYFSANSNSFNVRFVGYSASEVVEELHARLTELDMTSSLTVLSAMEAAFRIDYLLRCYRKKRDSLSRAFRELHKRRASKVDLER